MTEDLDALLRTQAGLATTAQLATLGFSRSAIRTRLLRDWVFVLPRVIATTRVALDAHQRLVAASLFAGPEAFIGSLTAAEWHDVRAAAVDRKVRVVVPAPRRIVAQSFVVVRRTRRPDQRVWSRPPLLIAPPARAVADAAREAGEERARAIVLEAVQRRIVPLSALRHELHAGPVAGSQRLRRALAAAEFGAWSVPEADLAELVRTSELLPEMWLNPRLSVGGIRLPTPDGWFEDVGLAVQVHSRRYHSGELDWESTVSADGVFAEHGVPVLAVTPRQIAGAPDDVLGRIEHAYVAAAARPRPPVVAVRAEAA